MLAAILTFVAAQPLLHLDQPRWWAMGLALTALLLAVAVPSVYSAPNRAWLRLGALLARVVAPIALTILFFGVFTPMGWLLRLLGRDSLRLAYDRDARSYWIVRQPPGPDGSSLKYPF